jgi:hypothetical protein
MWGYKISVRVEEQAQQEEYLDMFLRNVSLFSTNYTALYPRTHNSS